MTWTKGQSGNPGGKRKTEEQKKFEENCRRGLEEHGWPFLVALLKQGTKEDKKWAVTTMLDRGFGKPVQSVDAEVTLDDYTSLTDTELEFKLRQALAGGADSSPASAGTPANQ